MGVPFGQAFRFKSSLRSASLWAFSLQSLTHRTRRSGSPFIPIIYRQCNSWFIGIVWHG